MLTLNLLVATLSDFHEFLHQVPSLQSIDLVHWGFDSTGALHPVSVHLPLFRSPTRYVPPHAKVDLDLLSHVAQSRPSLNTPSEKVKLVFNNVTWLVFIEPEADHLSEHVQVVGVEAIDKNKTTRVP